MSSNFMNELKINQFREYGRLDYSKSVLYHSKNIPGTITFDKRWLKYQPKEAVTTPLPDKKMCEYIYDNNKDFKDKTALDYYGIEISYGQLFHSWYEVAKAFRAFGIGKGDIVSIAMPITPEVVYMIYGLNLIGAVPNMIDPRSSVDQMEDYLFEKDAVSKMIFIVDQYYEKFQSVFSKMQLESVIPLSPLESFSKEDSNWKNFIQKGKQFTGIIESQYDPNSAAAIVHTGGTTGARSKAVVLSNLNLNAASDQCILTGIDFKREYTWMDIMPPFIAYGVGNGLHMPLAVGMRVLLMPQFDPTKFDEYLLQYHPNCFAGVPTHWEAIISSTLLDGADLSFLKCPIVGGDGLNPSLEVQINHFLEEHNCNVKIVKGYGMTEVAAGVCVCATNECNQLGSVGIPFAKTLISIFNPETGEECDYGELGEIAISGPNVMQQYLNNPEANNAVLVEHLDKKIWVHSGDIGYITEDGLLYIVDRIKDIIVRYDGFKVYPSQIEKTILSNCPEVETCAVVGIPDIEHTQGQVPKVHVVLKEGINLPDDVILNKLRDVCVNQLKAEYYIPDDYQIDEEIPKTAIGKVDKKKIREHDEKVGMEKQKQLLCKLTKNSF